MLKRTKGNEESFFTAGELGMSRFMVDDTRVPIVEAAKKTEISPIPDNDGQTMVEEKFMHAKNPWRPKGRGKRGIK